MTKRLLVERSCSVKVTRCGLSSGAEMTPCTLASLGLEGLGPSSPRQGGPTEALGLLGVAGGARAGGGGGDAGEGDEVEEGGGAAAGGGGAAAAGARVTWAAAGGAPQASGRHSSIA